MTAAVELGPLTEKNLGVLKKLLQATFPVKYPASLIESLPLAHGQIAYLSDFPVAAVACKTIDGSSLYVVCLAVLGAYRRCGCGSALMKWVESRAKSEGMKEVRLHAFASSQETLAFYRSMGYSVIETVPGYYPTLADADACLLAKSV